MEPEKDPTKKQAAETQRFCMECGNEVEPGAEFCYGCGSRRIIDVNSANNRVILEKGECPYCGTVNKEGDTYCAKCGKRIGDFEYSGSQGSVAKRYLAMGLAIIPAMFNIFGLGHIVLKQYTKAFVYLVISAVFVYVQWFTGSMTTSKLIILEVMGLIVFFKQALEVFIAVKYWR